MEKQCNMAGLYGLDIAHLFFYFFVTHIGQNNYPYLPPPHSIIHCRLLVWGNRSAKRVC